MGPFQEHSVIDGNIFGPTGCRLKLGSRITPVKARPAFISVETGEILFGVLSERASNSRATRSTLLAAFSLLATCRLPGTHRQPTPVPGSGSSPRTPDPRIFGLGRPLQSHILVQEIVYDLDNATNEAGTKTCRPGLIGSAQPRDG